MAKNNPWLALSTYEEKDKDKFKGREQDTQNMLKMLQQNEYVVCYAASGDGKSSLINAGVCPEMRKIGYYPIKIVFSSDEYEGLNIPLRTDGKIDFDACILKKIEEATNQVNFEIDEQFASFPSSLSSNLWWKLRTQTIQMLFGEFDYVPVLIFDQFEEILRAKWKNEFFLWLETLTSDECPESIYDSILDYEILPSKKKFKAIFSMRYEYVGELDYWCSQRHFIPQMMRSRYFLKPFTTEQAEAIIVSHETEDNVSAKLSYNANSISTNLADTDNNVSAIMLSLLCYIMYEKWNVDTAYEFTPQNVTKLIFAYYEDILSRFGINTEERKALETVLISSNGTRRRMPLSDERLSIFTNNDGRSKIEDLVNKHILRQNDDYIELVHDRLVDAIYEGNKKKTENEIIQRRKKLKGRVGFSLLFCAILGTIGWLLYVGFVRIQYVERISGETIYEGHLCKNDTLYIESNSTIGTLCFHDNYSVKNVVIKGENITIMDSAFYNCRNLQTLQILAHNCHIGKDAFSLTNSKKIIIEGNNNSIESWELYVDSIEVLSVKGIANHICIPSKWGETNIQRFYVTGNKDSIFVENRLNVEYVRLAEAGQLYLSYDSVKINNMDILSGTSFDGSDDYLRTLYVNTLFLEDNSTLCRLNAKTLDTSPKISYENEVEHVRNIEKAASVPEDRLKYSVDEFMSLNIEERGSLLKKISSFYGYNDSCYAYGNVIYNEKNPFIYIAESAETIIFRGIESVAISPITKNVYVFSPELTNYLRCENPITRVHVPYGYGDYCRSNSKFSNCTIVEMSVLETIYERLSYLIYRHYIKHTFSFYFSILIVLGMICTIVYMLRKKKDEKAALYWTAYLLVIVLLWTLQISGMPQMEFWHYLLLLYILIILYIVYYHKKAKKYAILFGSEASKKLAFSIMDKIYKEGVSEKDVFFVSNYKNDWDIKRHYWIKNCIVILTKEELLEDDNEFVNFLSKIKRPGNIKPIVIGVTDYKSIVWPRVLRQYRLPIVFKALTFNTWDLREQDLNVLYRYVKRKWNIRFWIWYWLFVLIACIILFLIIRIIANVE